MASASNQIRSTKTYLWYICDVLGTGATSTVYKGRHKVRISALYHAVTILVMLPIIRCANMAPADYYLVQPQLGYNELEWSQIKMATP